MEMQHDNWIAQAYQHWKEHQPKRVKALTKAGTLGPALKAAAADTSRNLESLRNEGCRPELGVGDGQGAAPVPSGGAGKQPRGAKQPGYVATRMAMQELGSVAMPGEREA